MSESTVENPTINFFHIFAVAPALAYIFYENYSGRAVSKTVSIIGLVVIVFMILFHGYLAYIKTISSKKVAVVEVPQKTPKDAPSFGDNSKAPKSVQTPTQNQIE